MVDTALALALAALTWGTMGLDEDCPCPVRPLAVALVLAQTLPLAFRRLAPGAHAVTEDPGRAEHHVVEGDGREGRVPAGQHRQPDGPAFAGVAGGLTGDVLVRALQRRSVSIMSTLRIVGAVVPAVLWLSYFGLLAVFYSVGWTVELWAGIACMAALAGFGLALLMMPPSIPQEA